MSLTKYKLIIPANKMLFILNGYIKCPQIQYISKHTITPVVINDTSPVNLTINFALIMIFNIYMKANPLTKQ